MHGPGVLSGHAPQRDDVDDELDITEDNTSPKAGSVDDLLTRYAFLVEEMQIFADHCRLGHEDTHGVGGLVKLISHLRGDIQSLSALVERSREDETLEGHQKDLTPTDHAMHLASINHQIRSSNLPHYEALWAQAKQSRAITDFSKSFQWQQSTHGRKNKPVHLDVVADYGHQWIKISTVSEKRLVYEMAKLGWNADSDSEGEVLTPDDEEDNISVYQNALDLSKASKRLWAGDRHPKVLFVLTRLVEGRVTMIDKILSDIRKLPNITLVLRQSVDVHQPPLKEVLSKMVLDPFEGLTDVLNLDCTVMLSLASDLSHAPVSKEIWHKAATQVQIDQETKEPILPTWIYPAISGRRLVCTTKCHDHFRKIVNEIGTKSEQARAAILMGGVQSTSREDLLSQWHERSDHEVPSTLKLPIEIVDEEMDLEALSLSNGVKRLSSQRLSDMITSQLTDLNSNIFMYGWRSGRTTVTSNFNVTRRIIDLLNKHRKEDEQDVLGPSIWSRAPSRSLIAKEKSSFRGVDCPPEHRSSKMSYKPVSEAVNVDA